MTNIKAIWTTNEDNDNKYDDNVGDNDIDKLSDIVDIH